MTLKTPQRIADELVDTFTWPFHERIEISATELADALIAAVKADRAQRRAAPEYSRFEPILHSIQLGISIESDEGNPMKPLMESFTDEQVGWVAAWLAGEGWRR